jgi:hypothetical protein
MQQIIEYKDENITKDNIHIFIQNHFSSFIIKVDSNLSKNGSSKKDYGYNYKIKSQVKKLFRTLFFSLILFSKENIVNEEFIKNNPLLFEFSYLNQCIKLYKNK